MKIYIDFENQVITKTSNENVMLGDIYSNVFELLFYNYGTDTDWFPTLSQLAPNGRSAGDFSADALGIGETHNYTEDGVNYLKYDFTIGDGYVNMSGRSVFYIWVNRTTPVMSRKGIAKVNVNIDASTDTPFITDPLFNPKVKNYIDANLDTKIEEHMEPYKEQIEEDWQGYKEQVNGKIENQNDVIAGLGQLRPSGVATSTEILDYKEDKGIWIGSDTGNWYYWDGTHYVSSGLPYISDPNNIAKLKLYIRLLNEKKIVLNNGDTSGYYFAGKVNSDPNYTCISIDSVDNIDSISFECLQNNAAIIYFIYDDDERERFGYDVGTYNIKVPDNVKTIWINFWNLSYVNGVTINTNLFLPYKSGYIYTSFELPKYSDLSSDRNTNTACLKLPTSYTSKGKPTKLVIICHGASKGIDSNGVGWTGDTGYNRIVDNLNQQGYAVMDSNGYDDNTYSGHEHWSCPQALAGYIKAYDYFTQNYNLDKNVYLYGFSMGGLTALNLAINRTIPIRCIMVGAPVISLYNQCVERGLNYDFLLAYGMGGTYDADKCKGYDRFLDILNLNNADYVLKDLPPIRCAYGVDDTSISNVNIFQYFNALGNSNKSAIIKGYEGGHDISYGASLAVIYDMTNYFYYY